MAAKQHLKKMLSPNSSITLQLNHIILFLLGLAPYTLRLSTSPSRKIGFTCKFFPSKVGSAYNLLLIFLLIGIIVFAVPFVNEISRYMMVVGKCAVLVSFLGNLTAAIVVLSNIIHQNKRVNIENQLSRFDEKYEAKLLPSSNYHPEALRHFQHNLKLLGFLGILFGIVVTSVMLDKTITLLYGGLSNLILICFLLQFSTAIDSIKERFRCINRAFPAIKRPIQGDLFFPDNFHNSRLIMKNFLILKQARNTMYKVSRQIAEFYSFPTLFVILYFCCAYVDIAYYLLVSTSEKFTLNAANMNTIFWFLVCVYPVVAMSKSVRGFTAEMNETPEVIYDIIEIPMSNEEVQSQLNHYAVELMSKKVEFTACGFFSLDCTLLQSVFGMFVTYLLILLQFKPTDITV